MAKPSEFRVKGTIVKEHKGNKFDVKLDNGATVRGFLSGTMRRNSIRCIAEDLIEIELNPYDLTKGRIVYRYK